MRDNNLVYEYCLDDRYDSYIVFFSNNDKIIKNL